MPPRPLADPQDRHWGRRRGPTATSGRVHGDTAGSMEPAAGGTRGLWAPSLVLLNTSNPHTQALGTEPHAEVEATAVRSARPPRGTLLQAAAGPPDEGWGWRGRLSLRGPAGLWPHPAAVPMDSLLWEELLGFPMYLRRGFRFLSSKASLSFLELLLC